jgi:hypothetical protein
MARKKQAELAQTEPPPNVMPAPIEGRLSWENHRLRSANLQLQIENMRLQAAAEDRAGEQEFAAMQKEVGSQYQPRLNPQTKLLEFVLIVEETKK